MNKASILEALRNGATICSEWHGGLWRPKLRWFVVMPDGTKHATQISMVNSLIASGVIRSEWDKYRAIAGTRLFVYVQEAVTP